MVLSYSRQIFVRFFFGNAMANFLRAHVAAFESFAGVPRVALYGNLKSAVLERVGQAVHFHPMLLDLAAHYRFEPRPVAWPAAMKKGASSGPSVMSATASLPRAASPTSAI